MRKQLEERGRLAQTKSQFIARLETDSSSPLSCHTRTLLGKPSISPRISQYPIRQRVISEKSFWKGWGKQRMKRIRDTRSNGQRLRNIARIHQAKTTA